MQRNRRLLAAVVTLSWFLVLRVSNSSVGGLEGTFTVGVGAGIGAAQPASPAAAVPTRPAPVRYTLNKEDDRFLNDLSRRSFQFFWENADPQTGIVRDRARTDGSAHVEDRRWVGSIASTGFGLTALCIAADRGWSQPAQARQRARATLSTFADRLYNNHGWFHHFLDIRTGERLWKSEVSSIDTALFMGGVLTVKQCFADDGEIVKDADTIYRRMDFRWMLNGHPTLLSHGWYPERGFIVNRWQEFSEAMILYFLGLGSPTHPLPAASWAAWGRPLFTYGSYTYVHTVPPLFLHQVLARMGRFPEVARPRPAAARLVRELDRGDTGAASVLSRSAQGVFRIRPEHVGPHGVGRTEGLYRLGRAAASRGHRRHGRPGRSRRLADVRA